MMSLFYPIVSVLAVFGGIRCIVAADTCSVFGRDLAAFGYALTACAIGTIGFFLVAYVSAKRKEGD